MSEEIFKISACQDRQETDISVPSRDLRAWLEAEGTRYTCDFLLAYALDGVIWGKIDGDTLHIAHDVGDQYSAELNDRMLQEARLFGESAEIHIWRTSNGWRGCRTFTIQSSESATYTECINTQMVVWGNRTQTLPQKFTLMSDGEQGLHHAVPIPLSLSNKNREQPLRLHVRHYIAEDADGFARIVTSRLVTLTDEGVDADEQA